MKIKFPVMYDTSHWEIIPNFADIRPFPFIVSTKATEYIDYVDPTFVRYIQDIQQDGIHDSVFHYFYPSNSTRQANFFCQTVKPYIKPKTILVLDVEEEGISAAMMWAWVETVRTQLSNLIIIYGRKEMLDRISMTENEKSYFRKIPIWTAGYPNDPDLYSRPPVWYVPDQTKYGPVWMWQYTDKAPVDGVVGEVDANWVSPALVDYLGHSDTATMPFDGVTWIQGERPGGSRYIKFNLLLIDLTKVERVLVTNTNGQLVKTSDACVKLGADIGQNGHEWDWRNGITTPSHIAASDGNVYVTEYLTDKEYSPFLNVTADKKLSMPFDNFKGLYNTVGAFRYLIHNSVLSDELSDPNDPADTERHARSARGIHADGRLMLFVCDGTATMEYGLRNIEVRDIMAEYGAKDAADNDSGGSSTLVIKNRMVNTPSDPTERAVANHLLIWMKKVGTMKNKVTVTWDAGAAKRPVPSTNSISNGSYPDNYVFETNSDIVPDREEPNNPDKKWIGTPDGMYIATRYPSSSGIVERAIVTPIVQPAPGFPASIDTTQTLTADDGSSATYKGILTRQ